MLNPFASRAALHVALAERSSEQRLINTIISNSVDQRLGTIQKARHKTVEFPWKFHRIRTVEFPWKFHGKFHWDKTVEFPWNFHGYSTKSKPWNFHRTVEHCVLWNFHRKFHGFVSGTFCGNSTGNSTVLILWTHWSLEILLSDCPISRFVAGLSGGLLKFVRLLFTQLLPRSASQCVEWWEKRTWVSWLSKATSTIYYSIRMRVAASSDKLKRTVKLEFEIWNYRWG